MGFTREIETDGFYPELKIPKKVRANYIFVEDVKEIKSELPEPILFVCTGYSKANNLAYYRYESGLDLEKDGNIDVNNLILSAFN